VAEFWIVGPGTQAKAINVGKESKESLEISGTGDFPVIPPPVVLCSCDV
jgi:hypothetical protein